MPTKDGDGGGCAGRELETGTADDGQKQGWWRRRPDSQEPRPPASNKLESGVRERVLELVRQNYRDFGPTLAAEMLLERHGIEVSRETLRKWLVADGLWLSRKQRRREQHKISVPAAEAVEMPV